MFKRIANVISNTVFELNTTSVIFMAAVNGWPANGSADVRIVTESGADVVYSLTAQDVTDLKVGLTGINNDLRYIRKSKIESVTLDGNFFPSGQFANVTALMTTAKSFALSVNENDYNLLK